MSDIAVDHGGRPGAQPADLPLDRELVLKVIPMPSDTNPNGDIFGGWVMAQVDIAGAVAAARITQGRMATVAVNEFIFKQPVRVGDILSFFSRVVKLGNTSITVSVEVFAERWNEQGQYIKVTQATLTYVAIDRAERWVCDALGVDPVFGERDPDAHDRSRVAFEALIALLSPRRTR